MLWFILNEHEVSGPFDKEQVLNTFGNKVLIWGPGLDTWSSKQEWREVLNKPFTSPLNEPLSIAPQQPAEIENEEKHGETFDSIPDTSTAQIEKLAAQAVQNITESEESEEPKPPATSDSGIIWHYACNNEKFGPFTEPELIQMLRMLSFSSPVYVWNKDLDNWKKLEDFPKLMLQLTDVAA